MIPPDYVQAPLSPKRRAKMRERALLRFAPKGYRQVYGAIVPEDIADDLREIVGEILFAFKKSERAYAVFLIRRLIEIVRLRP